MRINFSVAACCVLLITFGASTLAGQHRNAEIQNDNPQAEGQISGVVKDSAGAIVPSVKVVIKAKGCRCETCDVPKLCKCCPPQITRTTNDSGAFEFSVPVGVYDLTFESSGFKRVTVTDVTVATGQTSSVDVTLRPGGDK